MKNKIDSLFGFLIICFTISFSCLAMQEDDELKKWSLSKFTKKCLWCCCLPSLICNGEQEFYLKRDTDNIEFFKDIPLEILYHILYNLSPLDIFHMSKTSKNLNEKINDRFWDDYLKIHQQDRWEPSLPPLKVAFAYSLYAQGKMDQSKMEKSALLGFPSALAFLRAHPEEPQNKLSGTPYFYQKYGYHYNY